MITLQQCINAWNAQADKYNQWSELDADERCKWCLKMSQPGGVNKVLAKIGSDLATYPEFRMELLRERRTD